MASDTAFTVSVGCAVVNVVAFAGDERVGATGTAGVRNDHRSDQGPFPALFAPRTCQ